MTTSYPKDKIKVLFLENISDKAVQYFKDQGYTDVKKNIRGFRGGRINQSY